MPTIDNWRALREALEAGPTEGERFIQDASPWTDAEGKFVQFEAFNISAGSADRSSDDYYRIASVSNVNDAPCNKANAMLIAAAHPAAIRSLLDERDRLAAEVESLLADAARLNWLDGAIFVHRWNGVIDSGSRVNWSVAGDYRHTCNNMVGNDFRAAIDAAMKGKL